MERERCFSKRAKVFSPVLKNRLMIRSKVDSTFKGSSEGKDQLFQQHRSKSIMSALKCETNKLNAFIGFLSKSELYKVPICLLPTYSIQNEVTSLFNYFRSPFTNILSTWQGISGRW